MTRRIALFLLLAACGASSKPPVAKLAAPGDGTCHEAGGCEAPIENQPRYELPDSNRPPPQDPSYVAREAATGATCLEVAQNLSALELGNYADEEKLGPMIAKHRSACLKHKLTADERQCVFEATDKAGVTWCAPRMTPGASVALVPVKECTDSLAQMRQQSKAYGANPDQLERLLTAVQTSCEQDRWTLAFRDCAKAVPYPGYVTQYCAGAGPAPLRKKLDDRIAHAQ